jgi:hypothetical protein
MNKIHIAGIAALLAMTVAAPVNAAGGINDRGKYKPKHDSNTLHKWGNAIQYPFRKGGENLSIDTHRATGHNSVIKNQKRGATEVENYNGNTVVIAKDNPRLGWTRGNHRGGYMHRRHRNFSQEGKHYYWFNHHRYYRDMQTGDRVRID